MKKWLAIGAVAFLISVGLFIINSTMITVPPTHDMYVRYKGDFLPTNKVAPAGQWAKKGEVGPYREPIGSGTYLLKYPWWYYETVKVEKTVLLPGKLGKITHLLGDPAPDGAQIVEGTIETVSNKGTLRQLLTPRAMSLNPFGFKMEVIDRVQDSVQTPTGTFIAQAGMVTIPTGSVGVRTLKVPNPVTGQQPGIQEKTDPPGYYLINPDTEQITVSEVGFWGMKFETELVLGQDGKPLLRDLSSVIVAGKDGGQVTDESEPVLRDGTGISFPSKDGWTIHTDFFLIWGMMPEKAAHILKTIGPREQVEAIIRNKVVSLTATAGSGINGKDFLVGEARENFQSSLEGQIAEALEEMGLEVRQALLKKVWVPFEVRKPIQDEFLAKEYQLTAIEKKTTAENEANFKEAEAKVELAKKTVETETNRLIAVSAQTATKEAAVKLATNDAVVAAINREAAVMEAEANLIEKGAEAEGQQLVEEAKAGLYELAVKAFGTPGAYTKYLFAQNLGDDMRVRLFHAGQGTLWTDLSKAGLNLTVPQQQKESAQKVETSQQ
jgi:hypothetical protein